MELRTPITVPLSDWHINHDTSVVSSGSCFAQTMAQKLNYYKFKAYQHPVGTLFNPASVLRAFTSLGQNEAADFCFRNGVWYNYHAHSQLFSGTSLGQLQKDLEGLQRQVDNALLEADFLIITLGTAWVHVNQETDTIVANCHKMPAFQFKKKLLSVHDCSQAMGQLLQHAQLLNPKIKLLLTVSPVRHTKETLQGNAISKATLRLAADAMVSQYPEAVAYFPAYEIMIDDLRDYRFYKPDMIHPTDQAEDYIWRHFIATYCSAQTRHIIDEVGRLQLGMQHTVNAVGSADHVQHLKRMLIKAQGLDSCIDTRSLQQNLEAQLALYASGQPFR